MANRDALLVADAHSVQKRIATLRNREEEPAAEEIAAIEQGNKEFREGRFVDLNKLRNELGRRCQQPRTKKSKARTFRRPSGASWRR